MTDIWVVYSTFPNRAEALSVARALVKHKVVACANLYENALSVYRWQGEIQEEDEVVMMAKTSGDAVDKAIELIKSLHPYELPCITAWPLARGLMPYLQWVADETAP